MTSSSLFSAQAAHRAAAVRCAEPPCCRGREYRNGVFSQTCRAAHAVTADRGTCQSPLSLPRASRPSCSPCSRMRHLSRSRQESWNWLSPHDMHIWFFTTVEMMPHTELVYPSTRHNAVNVRMVEQCVAALCLRSCIVMVWSEMGT